MLLHIVIKKVKINMYSRLPHFQLTPVIDLLLLLHHHHLHFHFHYHQNRQCHMELRTRWNQGVPIRDSANSVGLLGIRLMFSFKNIITATTLVLRDDCLVGMTSFIPP